MPIIELKVMVTLQAPILSRGTAPGDRGIDAAAARDHRGRLMISGDQVEGRLRESWHDLAATLHTPIEAWLGPEADPGGKVDDSENLGRNERKRLFITDLVCKAEHSGSRPTRVRIKRDAETGAASAKMMQVLEVTHPPGAKVVYTGKARFLARDGEDGEKEAKTIEEHLRAGLAWVTQLGGNRTIGFGRVMSVEVSRQRTCCLSMSPGRTVPLSSLRAALVLRIHEPWLVATHRPVSNLFESLEHIPGGVIKGTVANMCEAMLGWRPGRDDIPDGSRYTVLDEWFPRMRFTHLQPVAASNRLDLRAAELDADGGLATTLSPGRPIVPPLSLVTATNQLFDLARRGEAVLIGDSAPEFSIDWKEDPPLLAELFGVAHPERELRVRTKIDPDARRAEESRLFAYESIIPDEHLWVGWVDLPAAAAPHVGAILEQLRDLLSGGLVGLGKTKAGVQALLLAGHRLKSRMDSSAAPRADGTYIVTLMSDALLIPPQTLKEESGDAELHECYASAWSDLSNATMTLKHYYAAQDLRGGNYLRYRNRDVTNPRAYVDYVLTRAGSVFVLELAKGRERDARSRVEEWLDHGLPLPKPVRERYCLADVDGAFDWEECPYTSCDGYGEVAVNLPVHDERYPASAVPVVEVKA